METRRRSKVIQDRVITLNDGTTQQMCSLCWSYRNLDSFTSDKNNKKTGRALVCHICRSGEDYKNKKKLQAEANKEKRKENRKHENKLARGRYYNNWEFFQDKRRNLELRKNYNITLDTYNIIKESQNNRCAICDKHEDDCKQSLHVDHCHETGEIRGLLCESCNPGLGFFKDNPEIILKAYNYLIKTKLTNNKNSNQNEQEIKHAESC